ncbi:MAG TPA: M81 family metallopeptidase [Burkholderiaceae bacterium]|nr:M81 family metallopeptidase [Burkholderiaceae bacterium]
MRVFTATLGTETNTFAPLPTGLADFGVEALAPAGKPDEALHPFASVQRAARERAREAGWTLIEGPVAFATPSGTTTRAAYETLRAGVLDALRAAMPVDMVLLGLHGAMIADGYDDAEGDLLEQVRALVGPSVPIGAELDPHAQMTERKCANADIMVFFKEYPHTDVLERAREVVALTEATQAGRIRPVKSVFDCRMIAILHTSREPMRGFVDRMQALEGRDGVLSVSLVHGFPWGDVPSLGTRVLVITDDRRADGDALAERLGREIIGFRDRLTPAYPGPDEAIDRALALNGGPVVLADSADNTGGGAAGDSTFVLRRLIERGVGGSLLGPLWDPVAVRICFAAGAGARLSLRIGGKISPMSGDPIDAQVEVVSLVRDAQMLDAFGRKGSTAPLGDSALVRIATTGGAVEVVLNSERNQALGDLFAPMGRDWKAARIVVVKSSQHFYAVFGPPAREVIYVETPGAVSSQLDKLPHKRRPKGLWPYGD